MAVPISFFTQRPSACILRVLGYQSTTYGASEDQMAKGSKTFPIGRDSKTGKLIPVKEAKAHPNTTTIERMPKPGNGDTKK